MFRVIVNMIDILFIYGIPTALFLVGLYLYIGHLENISNASDRKDGDE